MLNGTSHSPRIFTGYRLLVGGTPIGSDACMIEHINTTVDAIIDEMLQLETYLHWTQRQDARSGADYIQDDSALQCIAAHLSSTHMSPTRYAARTLGN
jgi:hypothetical protein